jgi:hypothetical protein
MESMILPVVLIGYAFAAMALSMMVIATEQ